MGASICVARREIASRSRPCQVLEGSGLFRLPGGPGDGPSLLCVECGEGQPYSSIGSRNKYVRHVILSSVFAPLAETICSGLARRKAGRYSRDPWFAPLTDRKRPNIGENNVKLASPKRPVHDRNGTRLDRECQARRR